MARRTMNRMEKRAEHEAYEASQRGKQEEDEELEDDEDEEEEKEDDDGEAQAGDEDGEEPDEDEAPPPKKKKPAKAPKPRARKRTAKVPRLKVVWGVFSNTNQCVAKYDYPKKTEADQHAARLREEKKQTFFVQPVKEPIEEKKADK